VTVVTRGFGTREFAPSEYSAYWALTSEGATMRQTTASTSIHSRLLSREARDCAEHEARAWLVRQWGWEERLAELHVLADVQPSARCLEPQRAVQGRSGVLESPKCSAGVDA